MNLSTHSRFISHNFKYAIVVCTKNRLTEIRAFKDNLNSQVSQYLREVILVDGSNLDANLHEIRTSSIERLNHFNWTYLRTERGKPSGLNIAMDYLESRANKFDAVVFLDDDIYFSLTELETGVSFLLENKFCGLSPLIINENEICEIERTRLGVRESFLRQGKISSTGENYWINQNNLRQTWVTTEWLPGGAVIYNLEMIKGLRFSPLLENSMLGGYALGDDVDFSLRANSFGKIGCLTTIQVVHSSSLSSHRDFLKMAEARGRWKAYLLRQFPSRFSLTRILALESARAFWHFLNIRKYPGSGREIYTFLREFLRHLD